MEEMDIITMNYKSSAKEFVDQLLTDKALNEPSDTVKAEELVQELPPWFDEKKFNRGRKFYWEFCYAFSTSMLLGLVAVFAVPSIIRVLVGSRRSSSSYTAYRRYLSTLLHTVSWFEHELKPGSKSWKSLYAVRSRHVRAGAASRLKGGAGVSQRDVALTQFGFFGFSVLRPDAFGIRQLSAGDWDAYNHLWRTIGYMIGLQDRYNIARETIEETREVCRLIQERVFTPCLTNVPEYFEHMARSMLDGMWSVNPTVEENAVLFYTRWLARVPGYVYTEQERVELQQRIRTQIRLHSKTQLYDEGVPTSTLAGTSAVEGLPKGPTKLLQVQDFDSVDQSPFYKRLSFFAKYKLASVHVAFALYGTYIGRMYFNLNYRFSLILMKYFPYLAFFRFGVRASLVDIFQEDPTDDAKPKPNDEYYKEPKPLPWYREWLSLIW